MAAPSVLLNPLPPHEVPASYRGAPLQAPMAARAGGRFIDCCIRPRLLAREDANLAPSGSIRRLRGLIDLPAGVQGLIVWLTGRYSRLTKSPDITFC